MIEFIAGLVIGASIIMGIFGGGDFVIIPKPKRK